VHFGSYVPLTEVFVEECILDHDILKGRDQDLLVFPYHLFSPDKANRDHIWESVNCTLNRIVDWLN
jgi:hypothetical protein